MIRRVAGAVVAVLAAGMLAACTPNVVNAAHTWLVGQDGVVDAEVLVDRTTMYGTSGVLRGELVEGIDGARFDALIDRVRGYVAENPGAEIRLGYDDVDFRVEGASTESAREVWEQLRGLEGLVSALSSADGAHVRVLRPEARATLEALRDLPVAVELETFRDAADEDFDRREDDYGPTGLTAGSLQILRAEACTPSEDVWDRAVDTAATEELDAGTVDVCGDYDLVYREQTDLVAVASAWAERQASDSEAIPLLVVSEDAAGYHEIAVTPGDPSLFGVVAAFERPDAPTVHYWLAADGSLDLRGFEVPPSTLIELLAESPDAARLPVIAIQGDWPGPVGGEAISATGTFAELTGLVADAESLMPLDVSFYQVAATPDLVTLTLYSPPGTHPDMVSAAGALRSSPIWTTRDVAVDYLNGHVLIHDGVATIGADYTDREPYDAFIEAWEALDPATTP